MTAVAVNIGVLLAFTPTQERRVRFLGACARLGCWIQSILSDSQILLHSRQFETKTELMFEDEAFCICFDLLLEQSSVQCADGNLRGKKMIL